MGHRLEDPQGQAGALGKVRAMATLGIPYGRGRMTLNVPGERLRAVLEPAGDASRSGESESAIVRRALDHPIGSPRLRELARGKRRVLLITSDHTRPVPSRVTMPLLLDEIRAGSPGADIRILLATGFHRPTTPDEMDDKFGPAIARRERIINHRSDDDAAMVMKGILPSGGELWLNSLIDWADLVVSEGFIEPHFFAGFSGGRKSILPGIAATRTIFANHCTEFIAHPAARAGNLADNPLHRDMVFAAKTAGLAFILNVLIDADKRVIAAFAGDCEAAHEAGCAAALTRTSVPCVPAPIVVTSNGGHPLDQNIYQAVKGMTAAEACVEQGGVIVMVAACGDGAGGESFFEWFSKASGPCEVAARIAGIPRDRTVADQWEAQILARVLMKATVILVSRDCDPALISAMHMRPARSLEEAMALADRLVGADAGITVIPDGVGVVVKQ